VMAAVLDDPKQRRDFLGCRPGLASDAAIAGWRWCTATWKGVETARLPVTGIAVSFIDIRPISLGFLG
jgi:hypothetical protein